VRPAPFFHPRIAVLLACFLFSDLPAAHADWKQDSFLMGGFGIGDWSDPGRYVLLNDAGLDLLINNDWWGTYHAIRFRSKLDSLRAHRAGFTARGLLTASEDLSGYPGRCHTCFTFDTTCHRAYDLTQNTVGDSLAVRDSIRWALNPSRGLNSPSVMGWYIWDEPLTSCQMNRAFFVDTLIEHFAPARGKLPLVILNPPYGWDQTAEPVQHVYRTLYGEDRLRAFRAYVAAWLARFRDGSLVAPVLCIDYYPYENPESKRTDFLFAMKTARDLAAEFGRPGRTIPWWSVVQLSAHAPHGAPTIAEVRSEVYSALAYGAKGILYWTVVPESGSWGEGLLTRAGGRTGRYEAIRKLNAEAHAVGRVLFDCEAIVTVQADTIDQVGVADGVFRPGRAKMQMGGIRRLGTSSRNCLIGWFRSKAKDADYVLVVNRDTKNARTFAFGINSSLGVGYRLDHRKRGWLRTNAPAGTLVASSVPPGSGALFRLVAARHHASPAH
jgi:hypothetical protein